MKIEVDIEDAWKVVRFLRRQDLPEDLESIFWQWVTKLNTSGKLVLVGYPPKRKIEVIKTLRRLTGLGLRESKDVVESLPYDLTQLAGSHLQEFRKELVAAGADVA